MTPKRPIFWSLDYSAGLLPIVLLSKRLISRCHMRNLFPKYQRLLRLSYLFKLARFQMNVSTDNNQNTLPLGGFRMVFLLV